MGMMQWPARCERCHEVIGDWADAGFQRKAWYHKACFSQSQEEAQQQGDSLPDLRSPVERAAQLELPMLIFLLMFHFGLGAAVAGWIAITQGGTHGGVIALVVGIIVPLIGIAGVAVNILSRRRIEIIRQALELQGGWKPGR